MNQSYKISAFNGTLSFETQASSQGLVAICAVSVCFGIGLGIGYALISKN